MALLYLISFICIGLWISADSASTLTKKNFDVSDIGDVDPEVLEFVCQQMCSDHNSEEKGNYETILAELSNLKTKIAALSAESKPPPAPGTDVIPVEYKKVYPVHMVKSNNGDYKLTLQQAKEKCQEDGNILATRAQLEVAFQQGMDKCACGWLEEGYAAFPIQYPREGCFPTQNANGPGVRTGCTWQKTWNAWCFDKDKANKNHSN